MTITYNNIQGASNLITFTDIPNILKVSDNSGGTFASIDLQIIGNLYSQTNADGQWWIEIMGNTISNVLDPNNAINKNFYVAQNNTDTAASIVRALRNCPMISANFNITNDGSYARLKAKKIGQIFQNSNEMMSTNISATYLSQSKTDGSAYSSLYGSEIIADVYSNGNYITTLEKAFYDGETAFNMSPVLTTMAKLGATTPYTISLSSMKWGVYSQIGNVMENHISVGYMVNQGSKYLDNSYMNIAQNFNRGKSRDSENNTILYVYEPNIPISFYRGNSTSQNISVSYLDSAYNTLYTASFTWSNSNMGNNRLVDYTIPLSATYFNQAFYVDITIGGKRIRYNVIKPLNMTEYSQRILWRNSYGGISFFDFTGQRTETRDFELMTYQKNIYDYYTDPMNELDKVYDNEVNYQVSLKSHLFEEDGKYIFNDIIQSPQVWTEINGENYAIILDSVSVDEVDNNNIYEATIKYHYSQEPSII